MRVYKTKTFARFARKASIRDSDLRAAVNDLARGKIDADLGGGLYKQRLARAGHGKSGGFRVILAYRANLRAAFIFGFAKNEMENIAPDELAALKVLGAHILGLGNEALAKALNEGELIEVEDHA